MRSFLGELKQKHVQTHSVHMGLPGPKRTLDRAELQIVDLIVEGLRDREIADRLSASKQEVKRQIQSIFDKLGLADRLELVLYVTENGKHSADSP